MGTVRIRAMLTYGWLLSLGLLLGCGQNVDGLDGPESASATETRFAPSANRLSGEVSPYLVAHADNPVHWQTWSPEAFAKAKAEDKPVLLSVGYASCYWCHVMEQLVFSDEAIAAYLNEHFICIKVDREERPDVDELYMTGLIEYQHLAKMEPSGGWPLNLFLTPEGKPFTGGTYFPPTDDEASGRPGFPTVLKGVVALWDTKRDGIEDNAELITRRIVAQNTLPEDAPATSPNRAHVLSAMRKLMQSYDAEYGGFGFHPDHPDGAKFPLAEKIAFLQQQLAENGDAETEAALRRTLDAIANGALRDHLGGGFHRYVLDRQWTLPRFEKVLTDQAQLASVFLTASAQFGEDRYQRVATETLDFVLHSLTDAEGGFHSSIAATSEGVEGGHYLWTPSQIEDVLGSQEAALFMHVYGIDPNEPTVGQVPRLVEPLERLAAREQIPLGELERGLVRMRRQLLAAREVRPKPQTDDKLVAGWNGLTIAALARAGEELDRPDYTEAAEQAARYVMTHMRDKTGHLHRSARDGNAHLTACLDDYAYFIDGLLALHAATGENRWLNASRRLADDMVKYHWNAEQHAFDFVSNTEPQLIARLRPGYDAVLPSANAVAVLDLLALSERTAEPSYREYATKTLAHFTPLLDDAPQTAAAMSRALSASLFRTAPTGIGEANTVAARGTFPSEDLPTPDVPTPPAFDADPLSDLAPTPEPLPEPETLATVEPERVPSFDVPTPSIPETAPVADTVPEPRPAPVTLPEPLDLPPELAGGLDEIAQGGGLTPPKKKEPKVTVRAFFNSRTLPAGGTANLLLQVTCDKPWHLAANPPKPDFMKATEVVIRSTAGTQIGKVTFPKHKVYKMDGFDEDIHGYDGKFNIYCQVQVPANAAGKSESLTIELKYQACNDTQCLPVKSVSLKGTLKVSPVGQPIEKINTHLFP